MPKEHVPFKPVIAREEWMDISFSDDPIENGIINDLMRCGPRLRTLGHAYAKLDANAMHLIAVELAPRIREMLNDLASCAGGCGKITATPYCDTCEITNV